MTYEELCRLANRLNRAWSSMQRDRVLTPTYQAICADMRRALTAYWVERGYPTEVDHLVNSAADIAFAAKVAEGDRARMLHNLLDSDAYRKLAHKRLLAL
jgi:hypothetical protein